MKLGITSKPLRQSDTRRRFKAQRNSSAI